MKPYWIKTKRETEFGILTKITWYGLPKGPIWVPYILENVDPLIHNANISKNIDERYNKKVINSSFYGSTIESTNIKVIKNGKSAS